MTNKITIELNSSAVDVVTKSLSETYRHSTNIKEIQMLKSVLYQLGTEIKDWVPMEKGR